MGTHNAMKPLGPASSPRAISADDVARPENAHDVCNEAREIRIAAAAALATPRGSADERMSSAIGQLRFGQWYVGFNCVAAKRDLVLPGACRPGWRLRWQI